MKNGSNDPVGTPDELQAVGLDISRYGSCAAKVIGARGAPIVLGCPFHSPDRKEVSKGVAKCTLPCKGKGPEMIKVRTLKRNGRKLERGMTCFDYYRSVFPENKLENGSISRIVGITSAEKPLEYTARETKPVKSVGHNNTIKVKHEHVMVVRKIEPFKRPHENPDLTSDLIDEKIRLEDEAQRQDAKWAERMGSEPKGFDFLSDDFMGKPDAEPAGEGD